VVLDGHAIITVNDTRFHDDFGTRLVDHKFSSISDFLDQFEQVDLVLTKTRIDIVLTDFFDDHLSAR